MLHQSVVNTTACSPSIGSEGLFVEATQRYIPSLDGLRGLSIFLVFGVHGSWSHMQGGSVGVDLFFVLSGFLITQLLVREREKSGTINLTKFYARRFVRLFPPLLLMALCFSIYYFFTYGGRMVWMNLVPALTYISDFTRSRFDSPTAFAHLWSLALEEQFYLAWPLLMLGIAKFAGSSLRLKWCLFILIITINIWRGWLFARGSNVVSIYDGLDSRSDVILIGCALGLASKRMFVNVGRFWPVGLFVLIGWTMFGRWNHPILYFGGFSILGASAASVVAACVAQPTEPLAKLFSAEPLRLLGVLSYGAYLWHYPLLQMVVSEAGVSQQVGMIAAVPLSLVCASMSFLLLERPLMKMRTGLSPRLTLMLAFAGPVLVALGITYALMLLTGV